MGTIYKFHCEKCGYVLETNLGFDIFEVVELYKKTLTAGRNGEFGEEVQKFLLENPDGEIDCKNILKKCTVCGKYETIQDLTMSLPKKDIFGRKGREIFKKYPHKCKHCGGKVEILTESDIFEKKCNMNCPYCHIEMIEDERKYSTIWD